MRRALNRRTMLRGLGSVAVALPFLEAMTRSDRARAQASEHPQRFGIFFSSCGVVGDNWRPSGTGTDFTLGSSLAALEEYKEDLVVLQGLDAASSYMQSGNEHDLAMAHMLTGMRMRGNNFGRAGHVVDGTAGGPSIDQTLAQGIGGETKFRSVELGVESTISDLEPMVIRMSYGGPNDPRTPADDPQQVFERFFSDGDANDGEIAALHAKRQSVIDGVIGEFNAMGPALGYDDRQRLEQHASFVRDLENQLTAVTTCEAPARPTVTADVVDCNRDGRPTKCVASFVDLGKAQMDLMVYALKCDLTRVISLQWSTAESTKVHEQLGIRGEHHLMSHDERGNSADLTAINTWYAQQFAYLLGEMKKHQEGDGTLLDNTLMFWPNELSRGEVHDRHNLPYLLAGKAGGKIQTGRSLMYDGEPHNKLYTTFLNLFGVEATGFGEPDFPGTLTDLV